MIRLIATDMDGTLLDSACRLPAELPEVLSALRARGVVFCVASGRQYASLRREFEAVADQIVFICENGALVMKDDQRLFIDAIDPALLPAVIAAGKRMERVHPVICRADVAIIEESAPDYFAEATLTADPNVLVVPDLSAHTHYDDVCKVAFFDEDDAQQHEWPMLRREMPKALTTTLSGYHWVDVMKPGVHKGRAMEALMERLGLTPEECMAFGDYLNDAQLLASVTHSYAMENAHPQLKQIARHIAPSNDQNGVIAVIRENVLEDHCS